MLIRTAKRVAVAVIGGTVVLIGLILIVLPGPAFVVIPAGLAILATEFAWAKWMLKRAKERANSAWDFIRGRSPATPATASTGSDLPPTVPKSDVPRDPLRRASPAGE